MLLSLTFSRGWLREWKKKLSRHVVVVELIDLTLSNAKKKEKNKPFWWPLSWSNARGLQLGVRGKTKIAALIT